MDEEGASMASPDDFANEDEDEDEMTYNSQGKPIPRASKAGVGDKK